MIRKCYSILIGIAILTLGSVTGKPETTCIAISSDQEPYIYMEKQVVVMDTTATRAIIEKELSLFKDRRNKLDEEAATIQAKKDSVESVLHRLSNAEKNCEGKYRELLQFVMHNTGEDNVKDKEEKDRLMAFFVGVEEGEKQNDVIFDSIPDIIYLNQPTLDDIADNSGKKKVNLKNIKKDAAKGKISLQVMECLDKMQLIYGNLNNQINKRISEQQSYINSLDRNLRDINSTKESLSRKINLTSSSDDYAEVIYELTGSSNYPTKEITINEKVRNPYYRPFGEDNTEADFLIQIQGWEWAFDEGLPKKEDFYPITVSYRYSPEHPEYRILNGCAYDSAGNLVRDLYFGNTQKVIENLETKYIREQVINDYKNNKYGIQSKSKDVQYALKNLLGLSSEHSKKVNSMNVDNKIVNAVRNERGKSKKAIRQQAANLLGQWLARELENSKLDNADARNFITQCEEDHRGELGRLWKVDRLDNTTFQIVLYNEKQGKERKYTVKSSIKEPFGNPFYTVN